MNTGLLTGWATSVDEQRTKGDKLMVKLLIEVTEHFSGKSETSQVPVTAFGNTAESLRGTRVGTLLALRVAIQAREYQGKHYVDLVARDSVIFETSGTQATAQEPSYQSFDDDGEIPF